MTKVEMARDIFEGAHSSDNRSTIIKRIMKQTDSGHAYASTLYNKARKMGVTSDVPAKSKSTPDAEKAAFIKNCHKIQGLKPNHYRNVFFIGSKALEAIGVNKQGLLMVVKAGTKVKVKVATKTAMNELRKMKFLGKK